MAGMRKRMRPSVQKRGLREDRFASKLLRVVKRAMASVNIQSSVSFCEEDIPGASFRIFSLRLDSQSLLI